MSNQEKLQKKVSTKVSTKVPTTVNDTQNSSDFSQTQPFATVLHSSTSFSEQRVKPNLQAKAGRIGSGHNFGNLAVLSPNSSIIQPKLTIGQPGDKYELEADRVAAQVVQRISQAETQPEEISSNQGEAVQPQKMPLGKIKLLQNNNTESIQRYYHQNPNGEIAWVEGNPPEGLEQISDKYNDGEHGEQAVFGKKDEQGIDPAAKKIIEAGDKLLGQMRWGQGSLAQQIKTIPESEMLINCWDSVIYFAYKAEFITLEDIENIYRSVPAHIDGTDKAKELSAKIPQEEQGKRPQVIPATAASMIQNAEIRKFLGSQAKPIDPTKDGQLIPGQVIFIEEEIGDLSHVALASGSNEVIHMWTLQLSLSGGVEKTTLKELFWGYVKQKLPLHMAQASQRRQQGKEGITSEYQEKYGKSQFAFIKAIENRLNIEKAALSSSERNAKEVKQDFEKILQKYESFKNEQYYQSISNLIVTKKEDDSINNENKKEVLKNIEEVLKVAVVQVNQLPETQDVLQPYASTIKVTAVTPDWDAAKQLASTFAPKEPELPPVQNPVLVEQPNQKSTKSLFSKLAKAYSQWKQARNKKK